MVPNQPSLSRLTGQDSMTSSRRAFSIAIRRSKKVKQRKTVLKKVVQVAMVKDRV